MGFIAGSRSYQLTLINVNSTSDLIIGKITLDCCWVNVLCKLMSVSCPPDGSLSMGLFSVELHPENSFQQNEKVAHLSY